METLEIAHIVVTGDSSHLEHISWIHLCAIKAYERLKIPKQSPFLNREEQNPNYSL